MHFFKRFLRRCHSPASNRSRLHVEQLETRLALALPPTAPFAASVGMLGTNQTAKPGAESTAMDSNGDYAITWSSQGQGGGAWGTYAAKYSASGGVISGPTRISSSVGGDKNDSAVAMDSDGEYVVTWSSYGEDGSGWGVYAERFNAQGVAQGGQFRVNTTTNGDQMDARLGMDSQGNFVVVWTSYGQDGSGWGVYGQRYNSQGQAQGCEVRVNTTTTGDQEYASVAMNCSGNFVVTWSSNGQDGSGWGVYAQRYSSCGGAQGCEFRVNATTAGDQMYSSVAMDPSGDFVITWSSNGQDGSGWGVYARRYNSAGVSMGCEFLVNSTTAGDQMYSNVAMDGSGNFTITWSSNSYNGSGWGVYGQQYTSCGTAYGSQFLISTSAAGDQQFSSFAMNSLGQAIVVWTASGSGSNPAGVYSAQLSLL
jgi:hypothetical protein